MMEGVEKGFGREHSPARFQRQLRIVALTGKFERPPVLFPIASGLSPMDGNHRLFAHHIALQMPDEHLAKYNVNRPPASQSVCIASHKNVEDPKAPPCKRCSNPRLQPDVTP